MKVALLAPASSVHTMRWANGLAGMGINVHVISQHPPIENYAPKVNLHILPFRGNVGYFFIAPSVKKILNQIKPDILNVHFASGYGTTATLINFHPMLLSVWGSDVYDFPNKSPLHKLLVRKNLLTADKVASTSHCMAKETKSFTPELKDIAITPFGVDTNFYSSKSESLINKNSDKIVIGTVKTLAPKYGIDILINTFSIVLQNLSASYPAIASKLSLRIVGSGPQELELKSLVRDLNLSNKVEFVGRVNSNEVPQELNRLDIYVALSRLDSESFGVAIIEAGAAGRPVVVSNVGGLPEVVIHEKTGLIVPRENPKATADAIIKLILNKNLRVQLGENGRQHVTSNYDWNQCLKIMIGLYSDVINDHNSCEH